MQEIIDIIQKNRLAISDELHIFEVIFKKYGFLTVSEYAKKHNLTYKGVEYQIKNNLVQFIEVGNIKLLF
jgi:hypothetical protein